MEGKHDRLALAAMELACVAFAAMGVALPLLYGTPLLAPHRDALFALVGAGPAREETLALVLGITGGSIVGKWALHFAIVRFGLREGRAWARHASLAGLLTWFAIDSLASWRTGALFNVVLVNLAPFVFFGVPLAWVWRRATAAEATETKPIGAARWVRAASILGCGSGLAIAFAGRSAIFLPWWSGLSDALAGGAPVSDAARHAALVFFGPIGGCVAAQFVMMERVAAHAIARGRAWAAWACVGSIAAWFVVDSGWDLVHGGLFNVVLVNLPTLALTLPPLALAIRAQRSLARSSLGPPFDAVV